MQKSKFDLAELNKTFLIDNYLALNDNGMAVKNCISALQKEYKLKMMTKEDLIFSGYEKGKPNRFST